MISSEVQRTLVKSPPELWAELSDPEALARHLGELGEIRITRVEPESLVEWEADGTTGSVAIKPSAWGTKVTLRASREGDTEAPMADAGGDGPEPAVPTGPAVPAVPTEPVTPTEPAHRIGVEITAAERFAPDHEPPLRDERRQAPDPVPPEEPSAVWPVVYRPVEHVDEGHEYGDDESVFAATDDDDEYGPFEADALTAPEPEPEVTRQGFLSRLFGRRRQRQTRLEPRAYDEPSDQDFEETTHDELARSEPLTAFQPRPGQPEPSPPRTLEELWGGREAAGPAGLEEITDPVQPIDPAIPAEEPGPPTASTSTASPITLDEPRPEAAMVEAERPQPAIVEPERPQPAIVEPEQPEPTEQGPSEIPRASAPTLSEELETAEVTAVLTAVLDRLGSAHHRPFSRS